MKTIFRTTGIAMILLLTAGISAEAQWGRMGWQGGNDSLRFRAMRELPDSLYLRGPRFLPGATGRAMQGRQGFGPMAYHRNYVQTPGRGYRGGMAGYGQFNPMGHGFGPGHFNGKGRAFGPGYPAAPGFRGEAPGLHRFENIPNLTDKQKKDITALRTKQMEEMKKFREESAEKMKTMRETHQKNVLNLLTGEQKKFLETQKPPAR